MEFIQQFINGLNLGSIYALMALGYTMVYGIAKMLNLPMVILLWWERILFLLVLQCLDLVL